MALTDQTEQADNPLRHLISSAGTDVGMRREENQDSYGIITGDRYRLYIVADGMGGVQGGAIASNLAVTTIRKIIEQKSSCSQHELLKAVHSANDAIHGRGKDDPTLAGMGTTLVGLHFTPEALFVLHIGDSRAYRIREGAIEQLTEDHTLVQELVRSGAITEEQAEHHPVSHMLTRSMGPSPQIEVDSELVPGGPKPRDLFLLCSDGLYNMVKPAEIAQIVSTHSTDDAVQMLIDLANERGGTDNITVLIVSVGDDFKISTAPKNTPQEKIIADDYQIDSIEEDVPSSAVMQSSQRVGGYHETRDVVDTDEDVTELREDHQIGSDEILEVDEVGPTTHDDIEYEHEQTQQSEDFNHDDVEEDFEHRRGSLQTRLPLIAGGFLSGILVAYILLGGRSDVPSSTTTVTGKTRGEPVVAASLQEYNDEGNAETEQRSSLPVLSTVYSTPTGGTEGVVEGDLAAVLGIPQTTEVERIGPAEKSSIIKRKRDLQQLTIDLEGKLQQFDRPLSGEIGEMLKGSTKKAEEIRSKLDQIRSDIDLATRKLAVWYDRRRRLQTTDAVNMASEISVSVPVVKSKKEEFERATWDYLKEVEALRYSPGSPEREAHVAELVKRRAEKMKELASEVRASIDKALSEADHMIAELTLQRSQLEASLDLIKGDMDFVRTVTGNDDIKKRELQSEILKRRDAALIELTELNKLLPENTNAQ